MTRVLAIFAALLIVPHISADEDTLFGMHTTTADTDRFAAWEKWTGEPVRAVGENFFATSWNDFSGRIPDSGIGFTLAEWRKSGIDPQSVLMEFAVPMFPGDVDADDTTWSQGANGDFNRHFTALAHTLVQQGWGSAHLRLGWEFNLSSEYNKWGIRDRPEWAPLFVAYWQQIHAAMMSVEGADFKWVWGVILDDDQGGFDPTTAAWPGDEFVDVVGVDVYDTSGNYYYQQYEGDGPEQTWETLREWNIDLLTSGTKRNPYSGEVLPEKVMSLDSLYAFAQSTGSELSLSEWGIVQSDAFPTESGWGGNDNPSFIAAIADWIAAHDVKYSLYFEVFLASQDYGLVDHSILPGFWNQIGPNAHCVLPASVANPKSSVQYLKSFHGKEASPTVARKWSTFFPNEDWSLGDGWTIYRGALHHKGAAGEASIELQTLTGTTIGLGLLLTDRPSASRLQIGAWDVAFTVLPDGRLGQTELFRAGETKSISTASPPSKPYVIGLRYLPLTMKIDTQWNGTRLTVWAGDDILLTHLDETVAEIPSKISVKAPQDEVLFIRRLRQ